MLPFIPVLKSSPMFNAKTITILLGTLERIELALSLLSSPFMELCLMVVLSGRTAGCQT